MSAAKYTPKTISYWQECAIIARNARDASKATNAKLRADHADMAEALQTILRRAEISGNRWYADEARAALAKAGL